MAELLLQPVKASGFRKVPGDIQEVLIQSGAVPVNDVFFPLWSNKNKINLLYGSYGSGKSVFIVDVLINHAVHDEYFRCYFGRKILEDVRGTVFKTITDRIKELKKEHLFSFSDAPNGTMIIVCKKNRNEFNPFGANNPASLKSIKDPTHFFCEEFDQFTFEDFGFIYSRLRTEKAVTQFYGAFNTERIYQSHWLRKIFFDGERSNDAFKLKANYYDNYFIDQDDYYKKLQFIANGNAAVLNAIANGEWGVVRTGGEFFKEFDETKHVGSLAYAPGVVYVSLDENVNPYVTATIWQVRGSSLNQIHEILSKSPANNAPKAAAKFADYLDSINHKDMVFVCGDPSASKRSTVDENSSSFYTKYIEILQKRGYKVTNKVMKSAPEVALSGAFINAIFENNLNGWSIKISDMCFTSIEDYMMVKEDAEGKMMKEKEKDPDTGITYEPRGHCADTLRYQCLTILSTQFEAFKGRRKSNFYNRTAYLG
ncbi:MAG TPA: phage terminase large subunit [Chryseolinea sp.]|nr:phage terminase large subunit [Chryseolinea sp.]